MPITVPDQTIASQVQVPNGMQSLGQIMNAANAANQYDLGQQSIKSNAIDLQQKGKTFQDWNALRDNQTQWMKPDGSIDFEAAQKVVPQIAPTLAPKYLGELAQLSTAQTGAQRAKLQFTGDMASIVGQTYAALGYAGVDDPTVVAKALEQKAQLYPGTPLASYVDNALVGLKRLPAGAGVVNKNLLTQAQTFLSPEQQNVAFAPKASLVSTGGELTPTITQPSVAGAPPSIVKAPGAASIPTSVPPEARQSISTDSLGRQFVVNRDAAGNITNSGIARTAQSMPTGETPDTLKEVQGYRQAATSAAAEAPNHQFNANQIIEYADKGLTGRGAGWWTNLRGGLSVFHGDNSDSGATNTQLLGHAIAQQTATAAQSAGLNNSNASRELAAQVTADGQWTAPAIKSSARVMRAIGSTGSQLYNTGLQNAIERDGPFAARQFKNAWSSTANIDGIRLYDAMKNSDADPQGLDQVIHSIGGVGSARYEFALRKIDQMRALIQGK